MKVINHVITSKEEVNTIMHSRKFFNNIALWIKKEAGDTDFDIAMGCFDIVEISELFGVYVLNVLGEMYGKERVGCIETVA